MLIIDLNQIKSIEEELFINNQKIIHIEKRIKDIRKNISKYMEIVDLNIKFMECDDDTLKIIYGMQQILKGINEVALICDRYEKKAEDYLEEVYAARYDKNLVYSVIPDRLISLVGL